MSNPSDNPKGSRITLKGPRKVDSREVIVSKLQAACHALNELGIDAGPPSSDLPSLETTQGLEVDSLLSAAAGSSPKAANGVSSSLIGEVDEQVIVVLGHAIDVLATAMASSGEVMREQPAITALQGLLTGGALDVNCLMSPERIHLRWQLYKQLQNLLKMPDYFVRGTNHFQSSQSHPEHGLERDHYSPSRARPVSPHQFMHHREIAAQHQHQNEIPMTSHAHGPSTQGVPPHQFLFREKSHSAGVLPLPRSGQNMTLNFNHSHMRHIVSEMPFVMAPPPLPQLTMGAGLVGEPVNGSFPIAIIVPAVSEAEGMPPSRSGARHGHVPVKQRPIHEYPGAGE
ncbi:hypothetical protein AAFC00_006398 [Neodothiora populina]